MNYLLDTNHWSYIQRNHPEVIARIQSLPEGATFYMPVVAQAELLVGVELAAPEKRKHELRALYEQVVGMATEVLLITTPVAEHFAAIFADLKRKGKPIDTNDIWIAAIALAHNLILVTSDEHFQYVEGLQVEDWTKPIGGETDEEGEAP